MSPRGRRVERRDVRRGGRAGDRAGPALRRDEPVGVRAARARFLGFFLIFEAVRTASRRLPELLVKLRERCPRAGTAARNAVVDARRRLHAVARLAVIVRLDAVRAGACCGLHIRIRDPREVVLEVNIEVPIRRVVAHVIVRVTVLVVFPRANWVVVLSRDPGVGMVQPEVVPQLVRDGDLGVRVVPVEVRG